MKSTLKIGHVTLDGYRCDIRDISMEQETTPQEHMAEVHEFSSLIGGIVTQIISTFERAKAKW